MGAASSAHAGGRGGVSSARFLELLLSEGHGLAARRVWPALAPKGSTTTPGDAIWDGGFEASSLAGWGFNWHVQRVWGVEATVDHFVAARGRRSLRLAFNSFPTLDFAGVSQAVAVEPGREYTLRALTKAVDFNTHSGLKLQVVTPDGERVLAETDTVVGHHAGLGAARGARAHPRRPQPGAAPFPEGEGPWPRGQSRRQGLGRRGESRPARRRAPGFAPVTASEETLRLVRILATYPVLPPAEALPPNDDAFRSLLAELARAGGSAHAATLQAVSADLRVPVDELAHRAQFLLTCLLMPASGTHYEVLGVAPNATRQQIRQRWATLMQRYHPDHLSGSAPGSNWLDGQARRLIEAYNTLKDPRAGEPTTRSLRATSSCRRH